jgi:hypothetical protein
VKDFATDGVVMLLWGLGVASVTRLIVSDAIMDWLHEWAYNRQTPHQREQGDGTKLTYFLECPWCVSLWIAFATAWYPLLLTGWSWWLYPVLALAARYVVGLLATNLEGSSDRVVED